MAMVAVMMVAVIVIVMLVVVVVILVVFILVGIVVVVVARKKAPGPHNYLNAVRIRNECALRFERFENMRVGSPEEPHVESVSCLT